MATSYAHMIVFIVIYGFCDGVFATTINVLVITCVSQSQVPFAIDWELQITSIVVAGGPPAAGMSIYDESFQSVDNICFTKNVRIIYY